MPVLGRSIGDPRYNRKANPGEGLLGFILRQFGNANDVMPSVGALKVPSGAAGLLRGSGLAGNALSMSPEMEAALAAATREVPEAAPSAARSLAVNASAESGSGASLEALRRTAAMRTKGLQHVIRDRAGAYRPTTEDGALSLRPGESFGILGPEGFQLLDAK